MNMVIMHLSILKEKESIREGSSLEDLEIVYMIMKKKKRRKLIKTWVKIEFSALNIKLGLARNTKVQGDISYSNKSIEEKIQEGAALLVERERDGKNIFKC